MKSRWIGLSAATVALAGFCITASAVPLLCKEASAGHVSMDAMQLSSCLAADLGGIKDDVISVNERQNEIAIAVTHVGSDQLDKWFVYFLNPLLSSGDWHFSKLIDRNGRLSHIKLHGPAASNNVPEPGTLALLGVGLLGVGVARRRKRSR